MFLGVVRHAAGEHERQDGEREHVEDADHGEDVGPADAARCDLELVGVLAADAPHLVAVPAQRVEDAAQEQQQSCSSTSPKNSTLPCSTSRIVRILLTRAHTRRMTAVVQSSLALYTNHEISMLCISN